jgi:hypothetical protein
MLNIPMRLRSEAVCLGESWFLVSFLYEANKLALVLVLRVEKYRPDTLDDVVSHKDITSTSEYPV